MKIGILIIAVAILLAACGKNGTTNNQVIDVSSQQYIDGFGNNLNAVGTGPYFGNTFTAQELALFNSLDTADLSGTSVPPSVTQLYFFPNPSIDSSAFSLFHRFGTGFSGEVVAKIVIADSTLTPIYKKAIKVSGGPTIFYSIMPPILAGRFRMFITLSAEGDNNFYMYWVNITRRN